MSFLGGLGRLITGKPVFEPPQTPQSGQPHGHALDPDEQPFQDKPSAPQAPHAQPVQHPGRKELHEAKIQEYLECRDNGPNMDCELRLRNYAHVPLTMSRLEFMGRTIQLNQLLQPGQEYEVRAYSGPRPHDASHTHAKLDYKDPTGDYFSTEHYVEFQQVGDGTFRVARVRFREVRDI